jgi:hypothetical protein
MHNHQQPVAGDDVRQNRVGFIAFNYCVERVDHRLQPIQPLHFFDDIGRGDDRQRPPRNQCRQSPCKS